MKKEKKKWKVVLSPQVEEFLKSVSAKDKKQIEKAIKEIKKDPYKAGTPIVKNNGA